MPFPSRPRRWGLRALALIVSSLMLVPAPPVIAAGRTRTVQVGPVSIAYRSIGHGRPLVLLQGSGAAMDVWDPLMVAELADDRRVIVFDYRGVGGSSDEPDTPMTIDLLAKDTAGLMRALDLRRADVLGWSLGGFVAQRLAQLYPARVRRLVLVSTDAGGARAVLAAPEIRELDARVTLGQATIEEILSLLFPSDQLEAGQAWLERYFSQPGCCESVPYETGVRQLEAIDAWYSGPGAWDGLEQMVQPTLVLRGSQDIAVPPKNGRAIAERIPGAKLITFNDAGHGLPMQEPILIAAVIGAFLDS